MIRTINKDVFLLSLKAVDATEDDLDVAYDLLDTIKAHAHECVGMAANMIGVNKRILVFKNGQNYEVMLNPRILDAKNSLIKEEGCLCHEGVKQVKRFKKIKVEYQNEKFQKRIKTFSDFPAQIIQHEMDHFEGILV